MSKTQLIKDLEKLRDRYLISSKHQDEHGDDNVAYQFKVFSEELDEIISCHQPKKES